MPSSPEPATVTTWDPVQLHELSGSTAPSLAAATFEPSEVAASGLVEFEVGGSAGLPEAVVAQARAAARAAGYLAGWSQGLHDAQRRAHVAEQAQAAEWQRIEQQRAAEFARAISSLEQAAAVLAERATPGAADVEALIIDTALQIAEALVGHSLRHDEVRAQAALARVLDLAPQGEPIVVRLSVADHDLLSGAGEPSAAPGRGVTLVADPSLAPGDAVANCAATEIDARIASGLARVRAVLGR